jgi:eukaryotic-like serine/threonine-protein kinase
MHTVAEPARAVPSAPLVGRLVADRYELDSVLGRGGFGTVYEAGDRRAGGRVAVKVFSRCEGLAPRADREARTAGKLEHPGIHAVIGVEHDEDHAYLVSELVDGDRFDRSSLSDEQAVRAIAAVCDALAHAHARGIVHRDVKPANILVGCDGGVTLTDFGIARDEDARDQTVDERVLGTLSYMAPEQAAGERATGAADVWAAALTLYAHLAGRNPYRARTLVELVEKLGGGAEPLARARPDLPRALTAAVDAALAKDPGRRPDAAGLRDLLLRGLAPEAPGDVAAAPRRARSWSPPRALPVAGGISAPAQALLAGLGLAWLLTVFPVYPGAWTLPLAVIAGAVAWRRPVAAAWVAAALAVPAFWNYAEAAGLVWIVLAAIWIRTGTLRPGGWRLFAPVLAVPLAVAGVGPAFVLVAATAPSWRRRAGEAAAGATVAAVCGAWLPHHAVRALPGAASPAAYVTAVAHAPQALAVAAAMVAAALLLPPAWRLRGGRRVQAVAMWGIGFGLAAAGLPPLLAAGSGAPAGVVAVGLVAILPAFWALAGPRLGRPLAVR